MTEVMIAPDGKIAYTGSWDRVMRGFLLDVDELITLTQSRLTRGLTEDECL